MAATLREAGSANGSLRCTTSEGGSDIIAVDGDVNIEVFIGGDAVIAACDVGDAGEGLCITVCGWDGVCAGLHWNFF